MSILKLLCLTSLSIVQVLAGQRYCDEQLSLCFQEFSSSMGIRYRVAVPANAVAPFDVALQIVAPTDIGWAGFAWGGEMVNNPLTVAWPNSDSVIVTSRTTNIHALPRMNGNANVFRLKGSGVNETHWTANILCQGCSSWMGVNGLRTLNVQDEVTRFAWAAAHEAPSAPENPSSAFGYHDRRGFFPLNLKSAQQEQFSEAVNAAREQF
ncbi:Cellobiose dehydrogenase [Paramyrothecium foliicola]|nr:Cellobiose dehydrogenase [Paramyrothecium foliicola]